MLLLYLACLNFMLNMISLHKMMLKYININLDNIVVDGLVDVNIKENLESNAHVENISGSGLADVNVGNVGIDNDKVEKTDDGYESSDSDRGSVDDVEVQTDDEELHTVIKEARHFRRNKHVLLYENADVQEGVEDEGKNEQQPVSDKNQDPRLGEEVGSQDEIAVDEAWKEDTKDMESADSDYEGEDGNISPDDSSEEDDWAVGYDEDRKRKRKSTKIPYNKNVPIKEFDFCPMMTFDSVDDFKDVLRSYASNGGYPLWFSRTTKNQIQVKCSKERVKISDDPPKYKNVSRCPWTIWASYMQEERTFEVKTYRNKHICSSQKRLGVVRSKWLAAKWGDKIRINPFIKLEQLQTELMIGLGIDVSITQCGRVKKIALSEAEKSLREHYAMMWRYAREVYRANPGSSFFIQTVDRDNPIGPQFKRLYVCFDSIKKGWKAGCRPIIGIDGCFLKTFCSGELLSAVGRDGNDQMYPIAWGIVEVESKDSWLWFLNHLIEDLRLSDGSGLTLISDKQKGLIEAVKQLLPYAEHRKCARHVYANFRKFFPGQVYKVKFWAAAKATTLGEFNKVMHEIKEISEDAYNELQKKQDPHSWSRAFFSCRSKCDSIDNNMSECFNSWILKSRYKPIVYMLEDIRRLVMIRLRKNRDLMLKNQLTYGKRIYTKLNDNIKASRGLTADWNGAKKYEVRDPSYGAVTVDVQARSCSCRRWDLTEIPCPHAIAALGAERIPADTVVGKWYSKDTYLKAYTHMITPQNGRILWPEDDRLPIRPPAMRKMPGRPAKKRRREIGEENKKKKVKPNHVNNEGDENVNRPQRVNKRGGCITCSLCKQKGHNKVTCPQKVKDLTSGGLEQQSSKRKGKKQATKGKDASTFGTESQARGRGRPRKSVPTESPAHTAASSANEVGSVGQGRGKGIPASFQDIPTFTKRGKAFVTASALIRKSHIGAYTQ